MTMLSSEQMNAARALLNWSQLTLARACGFDYPILAEFEAGRRELWPDLLAAIVRALKNAGKIFDAGGEPGRVKLEQGGDPPSKP
jgi:transcriptional regulator with XRE-family HTH domain